MKRLKLATTFLALTAALVMFSACPSKSSNEVELDDVKPAEAEKNKHASITRELVTLDPIAVQVRRGKGLYPVAEESDDAQLLELYVTLPKEVKAPADRLGGFRFDVIETDTKRSLKHQYGAKVGIGYSAKWSELKYNAERHEILVPAWVASPKSDAKTFSTRGQFGLLYFEGEQSIMIADVREARGTKVYEADDLLLQITAVNAEGFWMQVPKGEGYWVRDVILRDKEGKKITTRLQPEAHANDKRIYNWKVYANIPIGASAEVILAKKVTIQPLTFELTDAWLR